MPAQGAVRTVELQARVKEQTINANAQILHATAQILPRPVIACAVAATAVRTPVPRGPIGSLQGP
jgi:hypothetical protein